MALFGKAAAAPNPRPRTFLGDVTKAVSDANDTLNPLKHPVLANSVLGQALAAGQLAGGVIDAGGAAAGRNLYDLNPRAYSDGVWNLKRLATTIGPNPNRPAFLNQPGPLQIPWLSPLENMPAPMLKREDAERHGEIAANVASLIPLGPEEAVADTARLAAPTLTEMAGGAARTLARPLNNFVGEATRAVSKTKTPFHFLDPGEEGDRLLAGKMRKDLANPQTMVANQSAWQGTGASEPSVIDLMNMPSSDGTNTQRFVRAAASQSDKATGNAVAYRNAVASQLKGNAMRLTGSLTPETRSADDVLNELTQAPAASQNQPSIDSLRRGLSADINQPAYALKAVQGDPAYGGIGVRQNLVNRISDAPLGDTTVIDEIANGEPRHLVEGLFGGERAGAYQQGLNNELARLNNANSLLSASPPVQTAGAQAAAAVQAAQQAPVSFALQKFLSGMDLNREERLAIVKRATSPLDPAWLTPQARTAPVMWPGALRGGVAGGAVSNGGYAFPPMLPTSADSLPSPPMKRVKGP